jgi:peptidyl-prolyl cis-trans isomerase SurA
MIDRKVLVHQAKALGFDLDKVGDELLDSFKEEQGITSDQELDRLLSRDGMSRKQARDKLIEIQIPREVIRTEVVNRVSVSDAEIQAYYESHATDFFVEGHVTFREIVLLADNEQRKRERRPQIDDLHRRILGGESFAALAGQFSEAGTKAAEGRLGPLKKTELSPLLVSLVFALPIGQVSDVVETPYGFHIVMVENREEDHTKPLHEVREELRVKLQDVKRDEELKAFMQRARAESKWCVKPAHQDLLPIPSPPCESL